MDVSVTHYAAGSSAALEPLLAGVSALIGALIGAGATLFAAGQQIRAERVTRRAEQERVVLATLKALNAEITHLFARHENRLAGVIRALEPNMFLEVEWPVSSSYFSVYEQNAGRLGDVEDDRLRSLIVETYTTAQGILDSLNMNTRLIQDLNRAAERGDGQRVAIFTDRLRAYAQGLREMDVMLSGLVGELNAAVAGYLASRAQA